MFIFMHILSRKLQIEDVWDAYNKDQFLTERFKNTFKNVGACL